MVTLAPTNGSLIGAGILSQAPVMTTAGSPNNMMGTNAGATGDAFSLAPPSNGTLTPPSNSGGVSPFGNLPPSGDPPPSSSGGNNTKIPAGFIVGGRQFASFDEAVAVGNTEIDSSYTVRNWVGYGTCVLGIVSSAATFSMLFYTSTGNATLFAGLLTTGLLTLLGGGIYVGTKTHEIKRSRKSLKNSDSIPKPIDEDLKIITPPIIAGWVNVIHETARCVAHRNYNCFGKIDLFNKKLDTGLNVLDHSAQKKYNFVELMGYESLRPLADTAAMSPYGIEMFEILAQKNPVVQEMLDDHSLMWGKDIEWTIADLSHPDAAEKVKWLIDRGNQGIIEFVRNWKNGGNEQAIDIWKQLGLASIAAEGPDAQAGPKIATEKSVLKRRDRFFKKLLKDRLHLSALIYEGGSSPLSRSDLLHEVIRNPGESAILADLIEEVVEKISWFQLSKDVFNGSHIAALIILALKAREDSRKALERDDRDLAARKWQTFAKTTELLAHLKDLAPKIFDHGSRMTVDALVSSLKDPKTKRILKAPAAVM